MTAISHAERLTQRGGPDALGPKSAHAFIAESVEVKTTVGQPDVYRHEVDFSLDLDLLSPEEQQTILELRAKVEMRRTAKQDAAEPLMTLRGEDMLTALAAKADSPDEQRKIVEHFVKSTARSMSPEEIEDLEGVISKTFRRIRGLGFRAALAASKHLVQIKDDEIAHRDREITALQTAYQDALDEKRALSADGTLYALTVENALDTLNGAHMGDTYEMELIEEAKHAVEAALPDAFKPRKENRSGRISTAELRTMTSRVGEASPVRGYPQGVGGQALIDALSLARPTSEY